MKKLIMTGLFSASLVLAGSSSLLANGTSAPAPAAEGLEISGNVDVITGYQHDHKNAGAVAGANVGGLGDVPGAAATVARRDAFLFDVDQVELDLAKSFGENIRLRADIDFSDFANTGSRAAGAALDLEQGYVTANLAAGNGIEFLIGKFNAPVGIESVDRNDNWLISYSPNYRWLTPTNVTGAKIYYAFSDLINWHLAVVNDLNSNGFGDSAMPSVITQLNFNWGDEGKKNTVGIGGGGGPESQASVGGASNNAHFDFYGDLDFVLALTDSINLAGEGTYRQSDSISGGANQKALAGQLALNYEASDVWDVTFRYGYEFDPNVAGARGGSGASTTGGNWNTGYEGSLHSATLGTGYKIADGAKMKLEYRFDYAMTSGASSNPSFHSAMAEFAYTF